MGVFSVLTVFGGAFLALWMPMLPFVFGLLVATCLCDTAAYAIGIPVGPLLLWSGIFFALAQVGYGLGAGGRALASVLKRARDVRRRPRGIDPPTRPQWRRSEPG